MPSIINATTTNGVAISPDNSGELRLQTNNGTTAVTIDTSQNVGIGTTSPSQKLHVVGNGLLTDNLEFSSADTAIVFQSGAGRFFAGGSERMRIDSSGNLLVGTTTTNPHSSGTYGTQLSVGGALIGVNNSHAIIAARWNGNGEVIRLQRDNTDVGSIDVTTTATSYNTSSDYRLKENIAPMQGALGVVQQLKPVTYNWKVDGSAGQGFIAHELAEVVPDCVTGEKDAVDEEGKPVYQGVDTSFLVATLTAAIQELKAELDTVKAEVQALKGVA